MSYIDKTFSNCQKINNSQQFNLYWKIGVKAGAAAIITLVNISNNSREAVLRQYDGLGYRVTTASISAFGDQSALTVIEQLIPALKQYEQINQVYYYWGFNHKLELNGRSIESSFIGGSVELQEIMGLSPEFGRLLEKKASHYIPVVLGQSVYQQFSEKGTLPLPGKRLSLNGKVIQVMGVAKSAPGNEVFSPDYSVFLKRDSIRQLNLPVSYVGVVVLRQEGYDYREVENILSTHVSANLPAADLFLTSPEEIIKSAAEQNRMFHVLTVILGLVSLIVGGIGIMNIMLVSVSERTSEIGVRLAIGAKVSDVRFQFLIEAVLLCLAGGLMGIFLALILTFSHTQSMQWPFMFSSVSVLIGLLSSVGIGLIFGYIPASSAAKLDPVKALSGR